MGARSACHFLFLVAVSLCVTKMLTHVSALTRVIVCVCVWRYYHCSTYQIGGEMYNVNGWQNVAYATVDLAIAIDSCSFMMPI